MKTINALFLLLIPLLLAPLAPIAYANPTAGTFTLTIGLEPTIALNVALDPKTGETLQVVGSGTFDTAGPAGGGGAWSIDASSGATLGFGTWVATGTTSFVDYGPPSNLGFHGGQLVITVTFTSAVTGSTVGIGGTSMTITCLVGSPPAGAEEGVTAGRFTEIVSGFTLLHLTP